MGGKRKAEDTVTFMRVEGLILKPRAAEICVEVTDVSGRCMNTNQTP